MKKRIIPELVTILFIILFLYTAISKVMDYQIFKEQLSISPLLSPFSNAIAFTLPLVEFAIVSSLIVPRWRLKGLYSSVILMILFTVYIAYMLIFENDLPCSCGGIISEMSWTQHVFFNSGFILLGAIAIKIEKYLRRTKDAYYLDLSDHIQLGG